MMHALKMASRPVLTRTMSGGNRQHISLSVGNLITSSTLFNSRGREEGARGYELPISHFPYLLLPVYCGPFLRKSHLFISTFSIFAKYYAT